MIQVQPAIDHLVSLIGTQYKADQAAETICEFAQGVSDQVLDIFGFTTDDDVYFEA